MPKPKRRKNLFGFGRKSSGNYIPASGGIAHHSAKRKASKTTTGASDSKLDDVAKSLAKGKKYASLSSSEQAMVRRVASKMNPKRKRKRNITVALPKNQFVNAKVRMKGGKIQVMADERVLGKAGFKGSAGLSGVSVSGGAKLNPKKKRLKVYKFKYGANYLYARGGRTVKYRSQSEAQAIEHFKLNHPEEFRNHDWKLVS